MSATTGNAAQRRNIRYTVLAIVVIAAIFIAGFAWRIAQPQPMSAAELRVNNAFVFDTPRSLPASSLRDINGEKFSMDDLAGEWRLIFFGFTYCPDICPTTMALLNRFYDQLPDALRDSTTVMLTTVDPARDTPDKMKTYVQFFNADFEGLTGDFLELMRFATALNMPFRKVPGGGDNYLVDHSGNIAILNDRGHYVGFFKTPHDIDKMLKVYQSLRATSD